VETVFEYKITQELGVLSENPSSGWRREVNLVSWNKRPAKVDIRDWSPGHEKMNKGVALSKEEVEILLKVLKKLVKEQG
jgi:hypothetical protein